MRLWVIIFLIVWLGAFACQNRPKDISVEEKAVKRFGKDVKVTRLSWQECFSLEINLTEDRTRHAEHLEELFTNLYEKSREAFSIDGVCRVFYRAKDEMGPWFVAMVEKQEFEQASVKDLPNFINELSFSEDMRKHACDFYRERVREKAFLVCTKHTELKKLFSTD